MTVKELKEKLKEMPDDVIVILSVYESGLLNKVEYHEPDINVHEPYVELIWDMYYKED